VPTYIALLRAINLGATRKFPKDAIIAATAAAGGTDVATYINTGNVRVTLPQRSRAKAESVLEAAYRADRGFEVITIAVTTDELTEIAADAADLAAESGRAGMQYVSVCKHRPSAALAREIEAAAEVYDGERVAVRGRAIHLLLDQRDSYHQARLGNTWLEKRVGPATNRNRTVITTLAERWGR